MKKKRVILTAGFNKARHVLAMAELFRRDGVEIAGLLVISPYNVKRLRGLVRQRGGAFILEALPRLLGREKKPGSAHNKDALKTLMQEKDIPMESLSTWAKRWSVPYRTVKSINDPASVDFVASAKPDWVVYGGGGIINNAFIDAARQRILNAHSGPLPEIRGMNACEWSLLLGYTPTVTIHLINRGIDTGAILSVHEIPVGAGDTVEVLRSRCVATGVSAMHRAVLETSETLPPPRENAAAHRQCFVMAPAMLELLEKQLAQRGALAA